MWQDGPRLLQAKAPFNCVLPTSIQKLVSNFCLDYGAKIDTNDISKKNIKFA